MNSWLAPRLYAYISIAAGTVGKNNTVCVSLFTRIISICETQNCIWAQSLENNWYVAVFAFGVLCF